MTEKRYYYDRALDKIKNRETGDDYWFLCDITDLLNKQDKIIKDKEELIKAKNQQLGDIKRILTEHYEYCKEKCEEYQTNIVIYSVYDLLRYSFKRILNDLGWDSE
jgi:hypothetical protein